MTAIDSAKVVVAVPTFRRPAQLRSLLGALARLERPCSLEVLVADNDIAGREGLTVVHEMQDQVAGIPIRGILAPERGLAGVRNALIAAALADRAVTHVAMIDDDEWPRPNWIAALLDMQRRTGADVVGGPVEAVFAGTAPAAIRASRFFRTCGLADGPVDIVWGTNNVLVSRACLEAAGPDWFDARYALTGGEDCDFFIRQRAAGRGFAWAAGALVHETVPETRARLSWLVRRAFRIGNTNALIQTHRRVRGRGPVAVAAVATAKLGLAAVRLPARLLDRASRADACCDVAEAGGMLLGVFGYRYEEYAR